jgi:hypothetical protein
MHKNVWHMLLFNLIGRYQHAGVRFKSSTICHCVAGCIATDVLEDYNAFMLGTA